jgi:3-oxoacyl-[acyl-carrier protein] reductase
VHFHGAEVAASDGRRWEHESPSAEAAHAFASELGGGFAVDADLSDRDAAQRLLDAVEDRLGPVDVVVNNAAHRCGSPSVICR